MTNDEYQEKLNKLFGENKYILKSNYKNNRTEIILIHNEGIPHEIKILPYNLESRGCNMCNNKRKSRIKDLNYFKNKLYKKYGNEYTALELIKIPNKNSKIKVRHNCEYCNNYEWDVYPYNILRDKNPSKCPRCTNQEPINNKEVVQFKSDKKYGKDKYTILTDPKNIDSNIDIKCNECGEIFTIKVKYFLNRKTLKYGCPKCLSNESVAILFIKDYLNENNIIFNDEVKYDKMIYKDHLKIDLLFNNIHLEYDGDQHFKGWSSNSKKKNIQQSRDSVKNDYCLNNSLTLIRIPYIEEANLEEILDAIINYNEKFLIKHNCLIIKENLVVNKPKIYSWYKENEITILNERKED